MDIQAQNWTQSGHKWTFKLKNGHTWTNKHKTGHEVDTNGQTSTKLDIKWTQMDIYA